METSQGTDHKERRERIAEAAYLRAERRGFKNGDPVADWIEAEHEVDADLRRREHARLIEQLEAQLATAANKLKSLKRKVSKATAGARKELERDIDKLASLRESYKKRLEEIRAQGFEASHKAKERAEKLWGEISETINRHGARKK